MVPKVADPDPYGSVRYLFELLDLDTDSFFFTLVDFFPHFFSAVAVQDPSNTIKRDLYAICEQFDNLEAQLCRAHTKTVICPPSAAAVLTPDSAAADDIILEEDDEEGETSDFSLSKNSPRNTPDIANSATSNQQASSGKESSLSGGGGDTVSGGGGGNSEDTCYSSSVLNSEEASVVSLPLRVTPVVAAAHYEECTVSSTVTLTLKPPPPRHQPETLRTEVFLNMSAVRREEPSELERNLEAAQRFLAAPLRLANTEHMEDELAGLAAHLARLEDAFLPARLSDEEAAPLLAALVEVKGRLRARQAEAAGMTERLAQCREEMSGLSLWMKEVKVFLGAEEAAYGELETLEAQLRESNALQVRTIVRVPGIFLRCSGSMTFWCGSGVDRH